MNEPKTPQEAMQLSQEVITRSKRILSLVDAYAELPTADNRTALRRALLEEFRAAAVRDTSVPAPQLPL